MSLRVLLVDDHRLVCEALEALLSQQAGIELVGTLHRGEGVLERVRSERPDVVVLDVGLPDVDGVTLTRRLTAEQDTRVLALSGRTERAYVEAMLAAGAVGYVPKASASGELVRALHAVGRGERYVAELPPVSAAPLETRSRDGERTPRKALGAREREVLGLVASGRTTAEIARALGVSPKTIETHRRNIARKLDLHSVAELTKYALRHGLTTMDG